MKELLSRKLESCGIKDVVISSSLKPILCEDIFSNSIYSEDVRSMMYIATGIACETRGLVATICKGTNESRSAYSGLTEAYYKKLPILFITIGNQLDYTTELNDCCVRHYCGIDNIDKAIKNLKGYSLPVHVSIEIDETIKELNDLATNTVEILRKTLKDNHYLFIGQSIKASLSGFSCKVVADKCCEGIDGCLSNVLGASLTRKRERYIGLVSEEEFLHDINVLGNIHSNDLLLYIVICDNNIGFIEEYAKALNYCLFKFRESDLNLEIINEVLSNGRKTVLLIKQNRGYDD